MLLSGAWGKVIHEKNLKQKISWHCPFKWAWHTRRVWAENAQLQATFNCSCLCSLNCVMLIANAKPIFVRTLCRTSSVWRAAKCHYQTAGFLLHIHLKISSKLGQSNRWTQCNHLEPSCGVHSSWKDRETPPFSPLPLSPAWYVYCTFNHDGKFSPPTERCGGEVGRRLLCSTVLLRANQCPPESVDSVLRFSTCSFTMEPEPWRLLDEKTWSHQKLSATWLNAASYVNSCSAPAQAPILA